MNELLQGKKLSNTLPKMDDTKRTTYLPTHLIIHVELRGIIFLNVLQISDECLLVVLCKYCFIFKI